MGWIAVDWGTTHCRAYAMDENDQVVEERESDDGMASLRRDDFEAALLRLTSDWLEKSSRTRIIASGMVGARQGWQEVAYSTVPFGSSQLTAVSVEHIKDSRLDMHIVAGVCQETPADVMRGEETQVAGLLRSTDMTDGVICLPGTHAKWCVVSQGLLESFQTFMTGEWYSLLAGHSVLRHDVSEDDWSDEVFKSAVTDGFTQPGQLSALAFNIRARNLVHGDESSPAARLSGLLLGAELFATRALWETVTIDLIGNSRLMDHYAHALAQLGGRCRRHNARDCTLSGLTAVYHALNAN